MSEAVEVFQELEDWVEHDGYLPFLLTSNQNAFAPGSEGGHFVSVARGNLMREGDGVLSGSGEQLFSDRGYGDGDADPINLVLTLARPTVPGLPIESSVGARVSFERWGFSDRLTLGSRQDVLWGTARNVLYSLSFSRLRVPG